MTQKSNESVFEVKFGLKSFLTVCSILLGVIILVGILTFVIPSGKYLTDEELDRIIENKAHIIVYNKKDLIEELEDGKLYISAENKDIISLTDRIKDIYIKTIGLIYGWLKLSISKINIGYPKKRTEHSA